MMDVSVGVGDCFVEFRPIPGASLYLLGSDGTVWSCAVRGSRGRRGPWRRRKLTRTHGWGPTVALYRDDGRPVVRSIRRLMAEVFPPVDADEEDLRPDPRASFGEAHGRAVLTLAQVRELRRLKAEGASYAELVERFGIARRTVHAIVRGETWAVLPPELPDPLPADMTAAPPPRRDPARRRGRRPRYGALRERPGDAAALDQLEMPRLKAPPVAPVPLDGVEVRRLHAEGATVRDLVARYKVRPVVIVAILKGE